MGWASEHQLYVPVEDVEGVSFRSLSKKHFAAATAALQKKSGELVVSCLSSKSRPHAGMHASKARKEDQTEARAPPVRCLHRARRRRLEAKRPFPALLPAALSPTARGLKKKPLLFCWSRYPNGQQPRPTQHDDDAFLPFDLVMINRSNSWSQLACDGSFESIESAT